MEKSRRELERLAKALLAPRGKNPYYLGERAIRNLKELRQSMDLFTEREAAWVADWLEYLGDRDTAQEIRGAPSDFKEIVAKRYAEIKPYLGAEDGSGLK